MLSLFVKRKHIFLFCAYFLVLDFLKGELDMPLWIWFVLIGIVVSAVMSIRTARQERLIENTWIEEEGEKYMERLRIEQEHRNENKEYCE